MRAFKGQLVRFSLLSASLAAIAISATPAMARVQVREFNIPAQTLSSALLEFSRQSDVLIVVAPQLTEGKQSQALHASLPINEAIARLLQGSGLRAVPNPRGGYRIERSVAVRNSPPQIAAADSEETEIIVTAQKRSERLLDVPQSVSVLSGQNLQNRGAQQLSDFVNDVPGLSFITGGTGYSKLAIRGVVSSTDSPTVGIYVDEVPYGSSTGFGGGGSLALDAGLFDIDRIEVLRGPQGTLYGASTMGGLLKYVTTAPDLGDMGGIARAGISDTHRGGTNYNAAVALNIPIVADRLAIRADGFYTRNGGYIDNLTGDRDTNRGEVYGGRVDLLFKPTDALSIRLVGFAQDIGREGSANADYAYDQRPIDGSLDQRRGYPETFDQRFRLVSGTLDYDFGGVGLTSISSYQTINSKPFFDLTTLYVPLFEAFYGLNYQAVGFDLNYTTKKFTQEVRLASQNGGALEWVVGGFYTNERSNAIQLLTAIEPNGQPTTTDLLTLSGPTRYREIAGFANITYHLTDRLDVSGGLRYARNRQRFEQNGSGLFGVTTPEVRSSEGVTTYLANLRYRFTDRTMAYLRYATGYRPGGPNFVTGNPNTCSPPAATSFESDRLKSYEVGLRTETADRSFGADGSVYYLDWSNIQIATSCNGFFVTANAQGGATVRGGELTLSARPTSGFLVTGSFAYQDAKLSEAEPALGGREGERLPNIPKITVAVNADYELRDVALRPTFGASVRLISDRHASFDAAPTFLQYRLPAYATVDLRAGLSFGPVDAQLVVRNLFDVRGQLSAYTGYSSFGGPANVSILQPRTIGINVTTRF